MIGRRRLITKKYQKTKEIKHKHILHTIEERKKEKKMYVYFWLISTAFTIFYSFQLFSSRWGWVRLAIMESSTLLRIHYWMASEITREFYFFEDFIVGDSVNLRARDRSYFYGPRPKQICLTGRSIYSETTFIQFFFLSGLFRPHDPDRLIQRRNW